MIKVEMNDPKMGYEPIKDYPCLGKSVNSELVVFFYKEGAGVVAVPTPSHPVGKYITHWAMEGFTPFEGKLTISNA